MTSRLKEPRVFSASALVASEVTNSDGEDLGTIQDLMLDVEEGAVAYAVVKFGGTLGFGEKLFAIPWEAISLSLHDEKAILQVPRDELKESDGFDKDEWPDMADREWGERIHERYGYDPYWASRHSSVLP
jgi:sporulation protein YlmC with PRC-barrel domain